MRFSPGDTVLVQRPRAPFSAVVLRVNAKSITVLAGRKSWRVPTGYPVKKIAAGSAKGQRRVPVPSTPARRTPARRRTVHADENYYMDGERPLTRRRTTRTSAATPARKTRMTATERAAGTPPTRPGKRMTSATLTAWVKEQAARMPRAKKHFYQGGTGVTAYIWAHVPGVRKTIVFDTNGGYSYETLQALAKHIQQTFGGHAWVNLD